MKEKNPEKEAPNLPDQPYKEDTLSYYDSILEMDWDHEPEDAILFFKHGLLELLDG